MEPKMEDFLLLDNQLQEDEKLIRDSINRFVKTSCEPYMAEAYEKASFPKDFVNQAAELGLFGITLPEKYGGSKASYITYGLICQELEKFLRCFWEFSTNTSRVNVLKVH